MKNLVILFLIFWFLFPAEKVLAQGYKKEEKKKVPAGMKVIESGGVTRIIAKDAQISEEGSVTTIEDIRHYTYRKLDELQVRMNESEARQAELKKESAELKNEIARLKNEIEELKVNQNTPAEKPVR